MPVTPGTTPFRGEPLPQHTSSTYWQKDCVPSASALCVNRTTVDMLRPRPWDIRQAGQVLEYRGMSYGEAVMGVVTWTTKKGRKIVPTARYGITRTDFKAFVDGGHACVISIACQITVNTLRATNDYTGSHSVSVHDYRWCVSASDCRCDLKGKAAAATDHGEYLVEDPGTTTGGWLWWSAALLFRAAEFRTGDGINCIVFPDTEGVTWIAIREGEIRTEASYTTGKRIKLASVGHAYHGGVTRNGGPWERADGTVAHGWTHVVYAGTTPDTYEYGWWAGRAGRQAA